MVSWLSYVEPGEKMNSETFCKTFTKSTCLLDFSVGLFHWNRGPTCCSRDCPSGRVAVADYLTVRLKDPLVSQKKKANLSNSVFNQDSGRYHQDSTSRWSRRRLDMCWRAVFTPFPLSSNRKLRSKASRRFSQCGGGKLLRYQRPLAARFGFCKP